MTIKEFCDTFSDGAAIEFKSGILNYGARPGMRCRVTKASKYGSESMQLLMDFSDFYSYNFAIENPGVQDPVLTARQAGLYRPVQSYYFNVDEDIDPIFEVVDPWRLALHAEYKASGLSVPYMRWLEDKFRKSLTEHS